MAKVIFTIVDAENESVEVNVQFNPPLDKSDEPVYTAAQEVASALFAHITDLLEVVEVDSHD